jgi:phage portal protein BeeE
MSNWFSRLFGRDVKTAATSRLVSLAAGRVSRWLPRALPAQIEAGYARNAVANRCVRLIAEAAATVPFRASDPAVQRLLDRPNAETSGPELWEKLYGYLQLAGNGYLELVTLDGEPRELFSLRPDRMRVLADPTGWPTGWEYGAGGYKRRFERDPSTGRSQVFHMRLFHPSDDHYGLSPLEPAGRAVDLHILGLPGDNTYANYREANLAFIRQTVTPLVRKTARALSVWLQPWFGGTLTIEAELPDPEATP